MKSDWESCPPWIRTTISGSKVRSPAIERGGNKLLSDYAFYSSNDFCVSLSRPYDDPYRTFLDVAYITPNYELSVKSNSIVTTQQRIALTVNPIVALKFHGPIDFTQVPPRGIEPLLPE